MKIKKGPQTREEAVKILVGLRGYAWTLGDNGLRRFDLALSALARDASREGVEAAQRQPSDRVSVRQINDIAQTAIDTESDDVGDWIDDMKAIVTICEETFAAAAEAEKDKP